MATARDRLALRRNLVVSGTRTGRSAKVTGDEPGTCKIVTGTEYLSANQSAAYCGASVPSVRKVGRSQTVGGQAVSGVLTRDWVRPTLEAGQ